MRLRGYMLIGFLAAPGIGQEPLYAPDSPGSVMVRMDAGVVPADESAAFEKFLQAVLDLWQKRAHLKDPRGFTLVGSLRSQPSSLCAQPPCPGLPFAARGIFAFRDHVLDKGQPAPLLDSPYTFELILNDPGVLLGQPIPEGWVDLQGRRICYQPRQVGAWKGLPVYAIEDGKELVVAARKGRIWWQPVSQGAFLEASIRAMAQELAAMPGHSGTPAADVYQRWMEERPTRLAEIQQSYEALTSQNPTLAESLRQAGERMEAEATESYRQDAEREKAEGAVMNPEGSVLEKRLHRYRQVLAAMAPEARARQAWYQATKEPLDPPLGPMGIGTPLAVVDPAFLAATQARTELQIVALRFGKGLRDPLAPGLRVSPAHRALWKTLNETPWGGLKALLAP